MLRGWDVLRPRPVLRESIGGVGVRVSEPVQWKTLTLSLSRSTGERGPDGNGIRMKEAQGFSSAHPCAPCPPPEYRGRE
jgi:hypothetical protein